MHHKRLFNEAPLRLPQPSAPPISPGGFILCPVSSFYPTTPEQAHWQQCLYRWAFEQAQAVVRPSLPERDLLATWN